jgi:hypothetical protein
MYRLLPAKYNCACHLPDGRMVTPRKTAAASEAALSFFLPDCLLMADIVAAAFCLSMGVMEEWFAPARFLPGPRPLERLFLRFLVLVVVVAEDEFEMLLLLLF